MRNLIATIWLALCTAAFAQPKPSFNCDKATTPTEKAICSDANLAELDSKLAKVYSEALSKAKNPDEKKNMQEKQKEWLKERNSCSADIQCLKKSYETRVQKLGDTNILTDARDGKAYKMVKIGGKTWMAENLNYEIEDSWCYEYKAQNCSKYYGRLYMWEAAIKACPKGWRLPDTTDWNNLVKIAGGKDVAGKKLKAKSGWKKNGNGTDDYGFSAMPGGNRNTDGGFGDVDYDGSWWTATDDGGVGMAYFRSMNYSNSEVIDASDFVLDDARQRGAGYSVRCVKD